MSMSYREMEIHLDEAKRAAKNITSAATSADFAKVATANALLVIAECLYRRELREG